jgi:hypothetical protein
VSDFGVVAALVLDVLNSESLFSLACTIWEASKKVKAPMKALTLVKRVKMRLNIKPPAIFVNSFYV